MIGPGRSRMSPEAPGTSMDITLLDELAAVYEARSSDPSFAEILREFQPESDADLAALIEVDGRLRIVRNCPVSIERYSSAADDLFDRPLAVDAAIDVTLRWMSRATQSEPESVEALIARFPQLAQAIKEAAMLNNALCSTTGLRSRVRQMTERPLPCEFGPKTADGRKRYELQKLLGTGAFGQVYQAVDRQLSEDGYQALVAIKILARSGQSQLSRHRLVEEATKARRVEHPNVVRVLDRGVSADDEDFIVYELVDSGDLATWFRQQRKPICPRLAARLIAKIARGVQAAHNAGLVHCDLKPGNIILTNEGEPKVADFGIAIRAGESLAELREEVVESEFNGDDDGGNLRLPLGNLAFISPEQYRMDEFALTTPSDVYALGGILFLLLTGRLPNGSTIEEIAAVHHPTHGRTKPPSLMEKGSKDTGARRLDCDLERICQRALEADPADRYSSAAALADDLETWLRYEPLQWTRPSAFRVARLWAKRRPAVAAITTIFALTVLSGGALAQILHNRTIEARAQAEIEHVRRVEEELRYERIRAHLVQAMERLQDEAIMPRSSPNMLNMFWTLQYLLGSNELRFDDATPEFWTMRFAHIENLVQDVRGSERYTELDALLWRTTLGFWLIERGDIDDAGAKLHQLRNDWSEVLKPQDRWLGYVDALVAVTAVRQVAAAASESLDQQQLAQLREAEEVLLRQEEALRQDNPASPLHLLVLETQLSLYGPHLLDQPNERQAVREWVRWCDQFRLRRGHR